MKSGYEGTFEQLATNMPEVADWGSLSCAICATFVITRIREHQFALFHPLQVARATVICAIVKSKLVKFIQPAAAALKDTEDSKRPLSNRHP